MNPEDKINQRERDIERLEGKLDSLATKEFVNAKFAELSKQIERERIRRMRITGAVSIIALPLVATSSLVAILVNLGVIPS